MAARKRGQRNIEDWEAALIKALLTAGKHTRDQIVSYFTRPDRTVNPARISEIASDAVFADVEPANAAQVEAHLRQFQSVDRARQSFFEGHPLHPVSLKLFLQVQQGTEKLIIEETDRFELKESLNFSNRAEYARLIAALANARGGLILFGVRDADRQVMGIKAGKLSGYDPAKLNQYLSTTFAPVPLWQKGEVQVAGKTVGVIFVPEADEKPLICLKDDGEELREGDIYYRYPGENRRIRPAELTRIIRGRARDTERQWGKVLRRVERAGIDNVAVLDISSGEVTGRSGRFLIEESLIPKLRFINEGCFSETDGEPTLRLLGDLQPIQGANVEIAAEVVDHFHVSDDAMMEAFVDRAVVGNPRMFIAHTVYSAKLWLPVFYFIRQAGLSDEAAAEHLGQQPGAKPKSIERQAARLLGHSIPAGAAKARSAEPARSAILDRSLPLPTTQDACKAFIKAVRTLKIGEVEPDFLMPLLKECWETFRDGNLPTLLQYAIAHVDVVWHQQLQG